VDDTRIRKQFGNAQITYHQNTDDLSLVKVRVATS
jgi:hypothetical protein